MGMVYSILVYLQSAITFLTKMCRDLWTWHCLPVCLNAQCNVNVHMCMVRTYHCEYSCVHMQVLLVHDRVREGERERERGEKRARIFINSPILLRL